MGSFEGLNLTFYCNYNYSNYSLELLEQYNLAWSVTAMVAFFLTLATLLLTVFYQSYGSILQRLFIYFILSIMANLAASATDIQLQPRIFRGPTACKWTGYSKTATSVVTLMFSCEISIYLLYIMYCQALQKRCPQLSKLQNVLLELGLLFIAAVIPPLLLIVPSNNFGLAGAVCWVKTYEDESCEIQSAATVLQWVIFSIYTVMNVFNLLAYAVLVALFFGLACKSQRGRTQYLITGRRTALLVLLLVLCTGVHLVSILITVAVLDKGSRIHQKWAVFILCTTTPMAQCIRPIAYMFYLNSIKKFRWKSTRNSAGRWKSSGKLCCRRAWKWLGVLTGTPAVDSSSCISVVSDANLNNQRSEYFTPILTSSMSKYGSMR